MDCEEAVTLRFTMVLRRIIRKLRHFNWLLNRLMVAMTNENEHTHGFLRFAALNAKFAALRRFVIPGPGFNFNLFLNLPHCFFTTLHNTVCERVAVCA